MSRWSPDPTDVLDSVAAEITHNYSRGRVIVAVDAADPAEAERFGSSLVAAFRRAGVVALSAPLSGFRRPRADIAAHGELDADERTFTAGYDYSLLRRVLLDPFKTGQGAGFVLRAFDHERDVPVEPGWASTGADAILVVSGEFAQRDELRRTWNASIWLESRLVPPNPLYRRELDPRALASAIVDVTDPDHPRRTFADAC